MRSNIIQDLLDQISPEEKEQYIKNAENYLKREEELYTQGYRYNTDKSYSLVLLNEAGHFPIGITYMTAEEVFIFKTEKEANKAWTSRVLGYDGWWYGKRNFLKYQKEYEAQFGEIKVYWLNYGM